MSVVGTLGAARGSDIARETVRFLANKLGPANATNIRRGRKRADSARNRDGLVNRINGTRMDIWRIIDKKDDGLDVVVQTRRNRETALNLLRKLFEDQSVSIEDTVTD